MADINPSGDARRPSPKALLELAERETQGKLKVFLGMAPGVGKTYAMLAAARSLKAEGIDVLVGVVETHGRSGTAALLDGLDVLARKPVSYRKRTMMEFDVEAAIARRPKLLLVDEFAHSNAPGVLHPKRYQDVEEVLRAGIDVWTTMNIQHLESLTDVIERIAGITVRETVPDRVLEAANEIVVVDLTPDELIKRLKEGKVYLPDNARRAIDQFFKLSNLTALRELTLRRAADRVDEQMLEQLRQQGIEGPWPTSERLMVCIGSDENSESVVRVAGRMAAAHKADWFAVHVRRVDRDLTDRKDNRRIEKSLRLAERLGATTSRLSGKDLPSEILGYAKRNNVTQILIGRSGAGLIDRIRGRSLSGMLVQQSQGLAITVVAPDDAPVPRPLIALPARSTAVQAAAVAFAAVAAAVGIGLGLEQVTPLPNVSMLFLFAVLVSALRFGRWPAIGTAFVSFLAYNYFFIEPRWTLTISEPYEIFSLLIFLVVAMVTGGLAGRLREQAASITERAEATQTLFDFSSKLSAAPKVDDVLWVVTNQAASLVKGKSVILLDGAADLEIRSAWPPEDRLQTPDWAAARWAAKEQAAAGRGTTTMPSARFHFRPLVGSKGVFGVLGVEPAEDIDALPNATEAALQSMAEQATIAIERTQLVADVGRAATSAESERLRAALLSSISHDLRTPLAAILGSATSLRTLGGKMPASDRLDLLVTIEEEAERLSRFVSNILDMTKLDAGVLETRKDAVDVGEVSRRAAERAHRLSPKRKLAIDVPKDTPLISGDASLLEQVILNLLDNAHKYSLPSSITRIAARRSGTSVALTVTDDGSGIPAEALGKVFDKFYRVGGSDGRAPGTGLGLSICAGLIGAMGGTIRAESPVQDQRGTRIVIELPIAAQPIARLSS